VFWQQQNVVILETSHSRWLKFQFAAEAIIFLQVRERRG
jgi:hypothetical protein